MPWYCWATVVIMLIALTARHLAPHEREYRRPAGEGESPAVAANPFARNGINDETYRQRFM